MSPAYLSVGTIVDSDIRNLCEENNFIEGFSERVEGDGIIPYGLSSCGYDIRLAPHFKIFTPKYGGLIDPKNFDPRLLEDVDADFCDVPSNSYMLASSIEIFNMPEDVKGACLGKSTYARCGLIINVTPLEPDWNGVVTIEISNSTPILVRVYANEGFCQFQFEKLNKRPETTYGDRKGKYQNQTGITLAKV